MIRIILKESKAIAIKKHPEFADQIEMAFKNGVKSGHLPWVALQLSKREPFNEIVGTIKELYKNHNNPKITEKDLLKYERLADLRTAIENSVSDRHKKITATPEADDYEKIYEDQKVIVVLPYTKEASCKLGQGTQWCVAATQSKNYFNDYSLNNVWLFYIITKGGDPLKNPMDKVAFAYHDGRPEIFNAKDKQIATGDVADHFGDMHFKTIMIPIKAKLDEIWSNNTEHPVVKKQRELEKRLKSITDPNEQIDILKKAGDVGEQSFVTARTMLIENGNIHEATLDYIVSRIMPNNALWRLFRDYCYYNNFRNDQYFIDLLKKKEPRISFDPGQLYYVITALTQLGPKKDIHPELLDIILAKNSLPVTRIHDLLYGVYSISDAAISGIIKNCKKFLKDQESKPNDFHKQWNKDQVVLLISGLQNKEISANAKVLIDNFIEETWG